MSVMQRMRAETPISYLRTNNRTGPLNSTPIRPRMHSGKQNQYFPNQPSPQTNSQKDWEQSYSPQQLLNNSKTIPKKRVSLPGKSCANHIQLQAEFKIEIDGEEMGYCNRCAAHLASNGFKVQRLKFTKSPRLREDPNARKRKELTSFLASLKKLQTSYAEKGESLKRIQTSHQVERQTISNFYASMLEYLEYIRSEHLRFVEEESRRTTQVCQIEADQIAETLEELAGMREDVQQNMEKIVEEVQEESYQECLNYYHHKRALHEHRLEELAVEIQPAVCTTDQIIQQKLNDFKEFIDEVSGVLSSKAEPANY